MRRSMDKHSAALILEVICLCILCLAPGVSAQQLLPPFRQVVYQGSFRGKYVWVSPKWHNGYLYAWRHDPPPSDQTENIVVYDRNDKLFGKARILVEDESALRITDVDVSRDGTIAAVGWAITKWDALESYLAVVSMPAGTVHVIETSPFDGRAVTFAPDGTIWVLGLESGGPDPSVRKAPDHFMVQHFGADGTLKGQYLRRSEFPCGSHPALSGNGAMSQISATADRIGIFAPACRMWVELGPDGKLLGHWRWDRPLFGSQDDTWNDILRVTLTPTNDLYATTRNSSSDHRLVRFDRESSTWLPVDISAADAAALPLGPLEGADGDSLVYLSTGKRLVWVKLHATP